MQIGNLKFELIDDPAGTPKLFSVQGMAVAAVAGAIQQTWDMLPVSVQAMAPPWVPVVVFWCALAYGFLGRYIKQPIVQDPAK